MKSSHDDRASSLSAARQLPGFRLADATADVRGWKVIAADGQPAATVTRLIVDLRTRKVRYLGIALDDHVERRARHATPGTILVPVGLARRVDDICAVVIDTVTTRLLTQPPRIPPRPITRADEEATLAAFGLPSLGDGEDFDVYGAPHFDDAQLFAPSREDTTPG